MLILIFMVALIILAQTDFENFVKSAKTAVKDGTDSLEGFIQCIGEKVIR